MSDLFDKIIKIEFFSDADSSTISKETIQTPDSGRKPFISLKGQLHARTEINTIEIRVNNLYLSKEVSEYKSIKITAGYKEGNQAEIFGKIKQSYVETPPPDSITVFELQLGDLKIWSETWVTKNYDTGESVRSIFLTLSDLLELDLNYNVEEELILKNPLNFNCLVQDAIFKLKNSFPNLVVFPTFKYLNVCDENAGSTKTFELDYITSAKKNAAGFIIIALWNPEILPRDIVKLNPLYFKQAYGGQNVSGSEFVVITIDFEFDTFNTNRMNLVTVETK